jgi:uncharacterized repeat protein (TIGR04138 family)
VPEQHIEIDFSDLSKNSEFPLEAFQFVRDGLSHTVRMFHGVEEHEAVEMGEDRHVSGQQLCLGLRDFALNQYGMLARTVLSRWGVRSTDDFGKIVFAMIDAGLMRRSDDDRFDDFSGVYDFQEAFSVTDEN